MGLKGERGVDEGEVQRWKIGRGACALGFHVLHKKPHQEGESSIVSYSQDEWWFCKTALIRSCSGSS